VKLNFNHPCKELIWVVQSDKFLNKTDIAELSALQFFNFSKNIEKPTTTTAIDAVGNPVASAKLQLNGHDRFAARDGDYFSLVQPYQHHTNIPEDAGINVYSFGLQPEDHQPSGTCNMSRIDNATLNIELDSTYNNDHPNSKIKVFAVNYNVLRVMSGMGGLAYSN
jgi:hypothetical protein